MKELFFISGLPRSGSTLLSALLRQNPDFYADISSPMQDLVYATVKLLTESEQNHAIDEARRIHVLRSLFDSYYHQTDRNVIFDTSRGWSGRTALLRRLYPTTKIICCVRDIAWIMDSFERIRSKNCLFDPGIDMEQGFPTVASRCDEFMDINKGGQIIRPYLWLEQGITADPDMILLVEYDNLCRAPQDVMQKIYDFIGKSYFDHDFETVEYENSQFDQRLNLHGLHSVRKGVRWEPRSTVLPKGVWDRYSGIEFWRKTGSDPASNVSNTIARSRYD